jgi:hypothetical protein
MDRQSETRIEDGGVRIDKRPCCLFDLRSSIFDPRFSAGAGQN